MGLVRDHDDVVAFAVGLLGVYILIELVNQAENVLVVLLEKLL